MWRSAPHRTRVSRTHTCDEKATHAANVAAEANLRLAGRTESVTLSAPNHGRFLLHLKAPRAGAFFCVRSEKRASPSACASRHQAESCGQRSSAAFPACVRP